MSKNPQASADLAGVVREIILRRIENGSLDVPAMPGVAPRVLAVLEDEERALADAVPLIESDPLIAAAVMRGANTAANGRAATIGEAVTRLGKLKLVHVVVEVSVHKLFTSKHAQLERYFKGVWEHSRATAMLARAIAGATSTDADICYLGGLLHDIGKIIVATKLFDAEGSLRPLPDDWVERSMDAIEQSHVAVGVALAEAWNLPDAVSEVVRGGEDYDSEAGTAPGNVVRYANALAKKSGHAVGEFDADQVEALLVVGKMLLSVDDAVVAGAIAEVGSTLG